MKDFLITIKIKIKAEDDVGARLALKDYFNDINTKIMLIDTERENVIVKLQEIIANKEPRKIEL